MVSLLSRLCTYRLVIWTFVAVSVALCTYDLVSYSAENCRVVVKESQVLNDMIWYFMRAAGYQAWAVPVLYVFWPSRRIEKQERLKRSESLNAVDSDTGGSIFTQSVVNHI